MKMVLSLLVVFASSMVAVAAPPTQTDFSSVGISKDAFVTVSSLNKVNSRVDALVEELEEMKRKLAALQSPKEEVRPAAQKCDIENCKCGCQSGKPCRCAAWKADGWTYNKDDGCWYKYPTESKQANTSTPVPVRAPFTISPYNPAPTQFFSAPPVQTFGGGGGFFRGGGGGGSRGC